MYIVKNIKVGELKTNCYFVINDETKDALIIDPGDDYLILKKFIEDNCLNVKAVLLTHGHFDHIGACKQLKENGIPIIIHKLDADKCNNNDLNLSNVYHNGVTNNFNPDMLLDGDIGELKMNSFIIKYIHTPGHSRGSVCYIIENFLFSGDTIFENGYGRTDFFDGSINNLIKSIKKLKPYLNGKYYLFAGH